jgi:hypothetical protein
MHEAATTVALVLLARFISLLDLVTERLLSTGS